MPPTRTSRGKGGPADTGDLAKWAALEAAGATVAVIAETTTANPVPDGTLLDLPLHWVAGGNPKNALVTPSGPNSAWSAPTTPSTTRPSAKRTIRRTSTLTSATA